MADYHTNALTDVLQRLAGIAVLPAAVRWMQTHATAIDQALRERVLADIPAFTASRNPDILPELARHGAEHTVEILRLLNQQQLGSFDFVREHARRRAEQRFPLDASLHAYRCGHKVYAQWLRQAVLATTTDDASEALATLADFAIEYTDAISTIAASNYSLQVRLLADVAGDQRAQLLSILLGGRDESDASVMQLLREGGYLDQRLSFCVALARSVEPDLALLDVKMPKLDGIEAARRILEERPIPIVMVTAYGEEELVSRAVEAGMKVHTKSERVKHSRKLVLELLASSVDLSTTPGMNELLEEYDCQPERYGPPAPPAAAGERDSFIPGHHTPPNPAGPAQGPLGIQLVDTSTRGLSR